MRELALPVFDAHTLPGSSYTYRYDEETRRAEALIVHQRPLNAPKCSLYIAQPDDLEYEVRMAESRRAAERMIRQLDRGLDPRLMNDLASAVVVHGNWIADGTTFTNSVTENVIGFTPTLAGSGAAIETITSGPEVAGGFWNPGRALRINALVVVSSAASSQGNLTLNWRLDTHTGNSVTGASATNALAASMASILWWVRALIVCRTVGTAGTLEGSAEYFCVLSATQTTAPTVSGNGGHNIAIDTTANHNVALTALFSAASASNIVGLRQLVAEVLN